MNLNYSFQMLKNLKRLKTYTEMNKMETIITYGMLQNLNNFKCSFITRENLLEIKQVVEKTIKYLKEETIIFLQKIDGRWYVN